MISHKYRCVFVHVPKTAGRSIEQLFIDDQGLDDNTRCQLLLGENHDPEKGPERISHLTAKEYVACGHVTAEVYKEYYKFSFVRNPWERLVSEYRYRNYWKKFSFKEFVLSHLPEENNFCDLHRHIIPQSDYLYDKNGNCLVDFIGRFESLQSDFDEVCKEIGFVNSQLPHKNKSGLKKIRHKVKRKLGFTKSYQQDFKSYMDFYDDELKAVVSEMYIEDIDNFGYRFGD